MSIKTLGSSTHTDAARQVNDFYATAAEDFVCFLDALKRDNIRLSKRVWECAAGQKHLSSVLEERGHFVLSSDLVVRSAGVLQHDFISPLFMSPEIRSHLDHPKRWNGTILTNPPFSFASEFIEQGLNRLHGGSMLILLLPTRYLEGVQRYRDIYSNRPPKYIYQYTYRIAIGKNGVFGDSNAVSYCWLIWEKDFEGETLFRWIDKV